MTCELVDASLAHRLENWGNASRGPYDAGDAMRITRAWQTLSPRHRDLLKMVYLWRADREVICRRLRIERRPREELNVQLAEACEALAHAIASNGL